MSGRRAFWPAGLAAAWALAACTPAAPGAGDGPAPTPTDPAPAVESAADPPGLVPAGYGTLRQDDFTVALRSGPLQVKVTPLDEAVIRLAAPDTYARLSSVARRLGERASALAGTDRPALFLVSFFSHEANTIYEAEDLRLAQRGGLERPLAIVPLTPGWGRQRLGAQETQSAVYAFAPDVDLELPLTVWYGVESSDAWSRIRERLDAERARARARAGG